MAFGASASNDDIFRASVEPVVARILESGGVGTVLMYVERTLTLSCCCYCTAIRPCCCCCYCCYYYARATTTTYYY